eukprot:1780248-Prymnesium_polylepis.2
MRRAHARPGRAQRRVDLRPRPDATRAHPACGVSNTAARMPRLVRTAPRLLCLAHCTPLAAIWMICVLLVRAAFEHWLRLRAAPDSHPIATRWRPGDLRLAVHPSCDRGLSLLPLSYGGWQTEAVFQLTVIRTDLVETQTLNIITYARCAAG